MAHVARVAANDFLKLDPADRAGRGLRFFVERLERADLALALACSHGAEEAWSQFERSYRSYVRGLVATVARSPSDAEEIAGSLLGDLFLSRERRSGGALASYRGRARLSTWLRTIVHFKAADYYEARGRLLSLPEEDSRSQSARGSRSSFIHEATPDGLADRRERLERLEQAAGDVLASLGARDRSLVEAYYLRGETVQSISDGFGVHKASVSRWLKHVRLQLLDAFRRALGPDDLELDDEDFWNAVGREFRLRINDGVVGGKPAVRKVERHG